MIDSEEKSPRPDETIFVLIRGKCSLFRVCSLNRPYNPPVILLWLPKALGSPISTAAKDRPAKSGRILAPRSLRLFPDRRFRRARHSFRAGFPHLPHKRRPTVRSLQFVTAVAQAHRVTHSRASTLRIGFLVTNLQLVKLNLFATRLTFLPGTIPKNLLVTNTESALRFVLRPTKPNSDAERIRDFTPSWRSKWISETERIIGQSSTS